MSESKNPSNPPDPSKKEELSPEEDWLSEKKTETFGEYSVKQVKNHLSHSFFSRINPFAGNSYEPREENKTKPKEEIQQGTH